MAFKNIGAWREYEGNQRDVPANDAFLNQDSPDDSQNPSPQFGMKGRLMMQNQEKLLAGNQAANQAKSAKGLSEFAS